MNWVWADGSDVAWPEDGYGFYQVRCAMTGCTVVGNCVAMDQPTSEAVFTRHGWQTDPYLCPNHADMTKAPPTRR